jgi:aspartate 1-decarboxylase
MYRQLLRCKLHHLRVTQADINYTGSLSLDSDIMDAAGIAPYERLLIGNVETGARFETYAIPAPAGSKEVGLNGAAARLGSVGDRIIVMVFEMYEDGEEASPMVIMFDAGNNIIKKSGDK